MKREKIKTLFDENEWKQINQELIKNVLNLFAIFISLL